MKKSRQSTYFGLLAGLLLISTPALADIEVEQNWSFEVNPDARFRLENVNGEIEVVGGSGSTIEVTAIKKADSQKELDRIEINVDSSDDMVSIDTKFSKKDDSWFGWNSSSGSVDYIVKVPASVTLDGVESVNGDVHIEGVDGKIKAGTVNGDIEVKGITGDVNLDTVNGGIEAWFVRLNGEQRAIMDTVNGSIDAFLPDSADVSVSADTVNGGIRGGEFGLEVDKSGFVGKEMEGDIGGGSARLKMDTVNGAIRLRKR